MDKREDDGRSPDRRAPTHGATAVRRCATAHRRDGPGVRRRFWQSQSTAARMRPPGVVEHYLIAGARA